MISKIKTPAERRPNQYDICPVCGGIKSKISNICKKCLIKKQVGKNHPRWKGAHICPKCGGPKASQSTICKKCYHHDFKGKNWWESGFKPWNIGMPRDLVTRLKISETIKERIKLGLIPKTNSGCFIKGHHWNNETMKRQFLSRKIKPNKKEKFLLELLIHAKLPYKYVGDGEFILGGCCPDFINTNGEKRPIELFGNYWHKNDDPEERINYFKKYGFNTLVIWESELGSPETMLQKIREWEQK